VGGVALLAGGGMIYWGELFYPRPPESSNEFVEVGGGGLHACGRRRDGTVVCWGEDDNAERGIPGYEQPAYSDGARDPSTPELIPVPKLHDVTALGVGRSHTCALRSGGRVVCWGSITDGRHPTRGTFVTIAVRDVVQVAGGGGFTCIRRADAR